MNTSGNNTSEQFLRGGGETGEIIRSIDWSKHQLGIPSSWPQSLRTTLSILLNSRFPMFLWWGPDLICFYNDAYRPSLGNNGKHPSIMGQKAEDAWPEIWDTIKPLIDQVLSGNGATWAEDQLIPIFRNGRLEDVYWTFSHSPVIDESGNIGGVLVTCTETTEKIKLVKSLEANKDELEFAIDAAQLGTWDYDPATNKFRGNDRLKEWFGISADEEIDLQLAINAVTDRDRKRVISAIRTALDFNSGGLYDIEYTISHPKTKKETVVHAKGRAWFNSENLAYRFNGTLEDVTEKALSRKNAEESEQKIRSLVKNTPFPMGVYVGKEMRIELANQSIIDIWGKGNDVIGKRFNEILPELDNQQVFEQLDEVFTTGIPFNTQNTPIDLNIDGKLTRFYFNYSLTPLYNNDGIIYGVLNTAADVTDLNIAKNKIEISENRFRTMAEGSGILIAESDETTNAIYFSGAWVNLTGRSIDELSKYGWADLLHPEDKDDFVKIYLTAFEKREAFTGEFRVLSKAGNYHWLYLKANPLFKTDGQFYGYISSSLDITERKSFEEQIRQSQRELLSMFEQSPVALAILDRDSFRFRMANPFYAEIHGRTQEELVGKPLYEALPELVGQGFEELLQGVIDTGDSYTASNVPVVLIRKGRLEKIYVDLSYQPLRTPDNFIEGILVVCTDVTQQELSLRIIESSEQDLRSLVLQAPIGICVLDANTLTSEIVNEKFVEVAGKPHEEIVGKYYWETFAETKEQYEQALNEVVKTGAPFYANEVEVLLIRHGIEEFVFVTFAYSPLKDANGNVTKIVVWVLDNTTQVAARRKIQEDEHKFRTLIEEATVATALYTGIELTIQYANDLMIAYWGKDKSAIGMTLADAVPELKGQPFLDLLRNVYLTGIPYVGVEECARLEVDGKLQDFYFDFTYKALRDKNGVIYAIHQMSVDVTARVKNKFALIDSEKKFRETVRQAPVGITILRGRDFIVEMANHKYLELVDREEASFVGKPLFAGLPEVQEVVEPLLNSVLDTGIPFIADDLPVTLKRFGKEQIGYFSLVYHPLYEEDGTVSAVMVVATEVTESVKAKQNLAESEKRFRNLVMKSPIPMTIFRGPNHIIEMANREMFDNVWRKKEEDVVGRPALEVFPELNNQKYPELLKSVLETGITIREKESEALVNGDDGLRKFYLDFEYLPLYDTDDSISGIMITVNDVTEKVEAREKIQESETYFRRMADSVPVMIWITEKDGPCSYVNKQWFEYTGQKFEDSLGYGWLDTIHVDDREAAESIFRKSTIEEASFEVEYRLKNSKGDYMWVVAIASPRYGFDGKFEGYIGTVSDINDRRNAEEKIKESDERSRLAIDAAELGTYEWIIGTPDTIASDRFLQVFGIDREEGFTNRNILLDKIHPDDRPVHSAAHELARETGILSYEARIIWTDKSIHWIKIKGKVVYDEIKKARKMLGTVMDITEQKNSLTALKESESRYKQLIQGLPVAVYTVDMNGYIQIYNEAAVTLWGRSPVENKEMWCGSHNIYDTDGNWIPLDKAPIAIALKENRALTTEIMVQRPNGEMRHVLVHPQPVNDTTGKLAGAIKTMVDITDLKRIEQALKISESRLSEAQRIAGIGNWEYNYTDKSFYCSEEVYRILSTSSETFVPSFYSLFRVIHPQDIKKLSRTLSFTRKTGLPFNIDFRIIADDNNLKHINSQGYVVLDNDHKIVKIIGTMQDITLRKLVEEELIEAKAISEKSLRYKEQFLANMSHEIRTPMNAIVGFTDLILKTPLSADQKQFIDAIKVSGENLLVIINDILDFSKLEAGAIHFEQIDFKLSEVVYTLTDLMLPKSVEKGINLSVAIEPTITDNLVGDPTRLNQILLNLVGNAIKFTEKGEVKISAAPVWENEKNIEIQFSVIDTGIGIEENMTETIFNVFTQTSSDTTRKYGGSGLGLAIVKQFVEKQGGTITVESTLGVGSTFKFTLMFEKSLTTQNQVGELTTESSTHHTPKALKILLVEDNKLNQLLASKALSDWDWEVEIADNGLIALDKVAKNDFDLILMDIQLPEMDGYEATRYIRNTFEAPKCNIPIIAVTAHAMQSEAQKCHDAGMNGYISKPFSPKMLYEGIVQVIEAHKNNKKTIKN